MWEMSLKVHIKVVYINLSKFHLYHKVTNEALSILNEFDQAFHYF